MTLHRVTALASCAAPASTAPAHTVIITPPPPLAHEGPKHQSPFPATYQEALRAFAPRRPRTVARPYALQATANTAMQFPTAGGDYEGTADELTMLRQKVADQLNTLLTLQSQIVRLRQAEYELTNLYCERVAFQANAASSSSSKHPRLIRPSGHSWRSAFEATAAKSQAPTARADGALLTTTVASSQTEPKINKDNNISSSNPDAKAAARALVQAATRLECEVTEVVDPMPPPPPSSATTPRRHGKRPRPIPSTMADKPFAVNACYPKRIRLPSFKARKAAEAAARRLRLP